MFLSNDHFLLNNFEKSYFIDRFTGGITCSGMVRWGPKGYFKKHKKFHLLFSTNSGH